jgi:hypothetical protein
LYQASHIMIKNRAFFEQEREAPLLSRGGDFLVRHADKIEEIVSKWPEVVQVPKHELENKDSFVWASRSDISPENQRIVVADAERTFLGAPHREAMTKVLTTVIKRFQDYGQGLGYVTSFLMLTLDEPTVVAILSRLNDDERYFKGYWKHEAVGFATDAYVFEHLLSLHFADVALHLKNRFIHPETFCQKWFVGLCIHVLPLEALFEFFDNLFRVGHPFLFQFGLSLIDHLKDEILKTTDAGSLYALLRLEPKVVRPELAISIVKRANEFANQVSQISIPELRKHMYETKLKARIDSARKAFQEAKGDDDVDTDSEGGSESESEDEEGGGECRICKEMVPEVFCKDCNLPICGLCHDRERGEHRKGHKVVEDADEMEELTKGLKEVKI